MQARGSTAPFLFVLRLCFCPRALNADGFLASQRSRGWKQELLGPKRAVVAGPEEASNTEFPWTSVTLSKATRLVRHKGTGFRTGGARLEKGRTSRETTQGLCGLRFVDAVLASATGTAGHGTEGGIRGRIIAAMIVLEAGRAKVNHDVWRSGSVWTTRDGGCRIHFDGGPEKTDRWPHEGRPALPWRPPDLNLL